MTYFTNENNSEYDIETTMPIVVGMQPFAEIWHRPLAYRLRDRINDWQETFCDEQVITPVVLTDVWVLNHPAYETIPALAVGGPRHNALTAFLTEHLPVIAAHEDQYLLQMDENAPTLRACIWGSDPENTQLAVDLFLENYIDDWMRTIMNKKQSTSPLPNNH